VSHAAAPLVAVDDLSFERVDGGLEIKVSKAVDAGELYLRAHFPEFVIYPGVFFIETVDQATTTALARCGAGPAFRLTALRSARFPAPLLAGDRVRMRITVSLGTTAGSVSVARARGRRGDGMTCAQLVAEFSPVSAGALGVPAGSGAWGAGDA
jgi:3-hydroxyacyl-[acyl-carrier-protein] dehydratase